MGLKYKRDKNVKALNRLSFNDIRGFFAFLTVLLFSHAAYAQNVSNIAENITTSLASLPGLVSAFAYVIGVLFGVAGILKLKGHVETPDNGSGQGVTLRSGVIRIVAAGAFFALPIVFEAMLNTFVGTGDNGFEFSGGSPGIDGFARLAEGENNVNAVLGNIIASIQDLPGLVTAIAYLLGTIFGVIGIFKMKEHVEAPSQISLKEPVIRILIGGALFATPTIFTAMFSLFGGTDIAAFFSSGSTNVGEQNSVFSGYAQEGCEAGGDKLGSVICGIGANAGLFPAFLTALGYLFGLVLGLWGILKIRDHVLNPQQVQITEGVARLFAGGAFFALPAIVEVFRNTLSNDELSDSSINAISNGYNDGDIACDGSGLGLDGLLSCAMSDVFAPLHLALNLFTFVAGIIFIMIGISRLIKGAQDGARGPGGLGTMMSFIIGGALVSYNEMMRAASATFTGEATTKTFGALQYTDGLDESVQASANAVIAAVIKFMIIVGLISFVRGLFIVRSVAEGSNQQASIMAAVTHIIGGSLAVNLGPLLNAIQQTLGIADFGIAFS